MLICCAGGERQLVMQVGGVILWWSSSSGILSWLRVGKGHQERPGRWMLPSILATLAVLYWMPVVRLWAGGGDWWPSDKLQIIFWLQKGWTWRYFHCLCAQVSRRKALWLLPPPYVFLRVPPLRGTVVSNRDIASWNVQQLEMYLLFEAGKYPNTLPACVSCFEAVGVAFATIRNSANIGLLSDFSWALPSTNVAARESFGPMLEQASTRHLNWLSSILGYSGVLQMLRRLT